MAKKIKTTIKPTKASDLSYKEASEAMDRIVNRLARKDNLTYNQAVARLREVAPQAFTNLEAAYRRQRSK